MKKILIIEDETFVVSFIKKGLVEAGFDVYVAQSGVSGYEMCSNNTFQLIIMDIMLPDKNGIEICKEIRKANSKVPILFLTALNTSDNIALGLDAGGDDYLTKPFKFVELIARINALLRRSNSFTEKPAMNLIRIADLEIDDNAKTVIRNGEKILLTATEYRLLKYLIVKKGHVLSRLDILEHVWDINFNLGTNVVDVYINYLRKKIDASHDSKLIHTVIGMGYVLKES
jgi:two-component system copper resistance phosphate regulon response regulator CusR